MRKVIAIGQSVLDIVHVDGKPVESFVGGRIANMAIRLGQAGEKVEFVSECAVDAVGDMIVAQLKKSGVGTDSVDRYTDGLSQVSLIFRDSRTGDERYTRYVQYPDNRFDVLWPRIEQDDIVVFGSFFALEASLRKQLTELLSYAVERKALILYLPGFKKELCSRITRVMPSILENLDLADIVLARESDMVQIFGKGDSRQCYEDHIRFYCPNFLFAGDDFSLKMYAPDTDIRIDCGKPALCSQLSWHASLCAGFVEGLLRQGVTRETLGTVPAETWKKIVNQSLSKTYEADTVR